MRRIWLPVMGGALLVVVDACAPVRQVRPLPAEAMQWRATFGGPVIHFAGAVLPIPFTSVGVDRGLTNRWTVGATAYPTAWLFGAFQMDAHALYGVYQPDPQQAPWIPGLSVGGALNYTIERWEWRHRLWPEASLNLWWELGPRVMIYGGVANWWELRTTRAHAQPQRYHWIWNPHLGIQWGRKRRTYQVEVKALAPFAPNDEVVVDYVKPFGRRGALGVYVAVAKQWRKASKSTVR